jgi:Mn-containing catalase
VPVVVFDELSTEELGIVELVGDIVVAVDTDADNVEIRTAFW